MTNAQAPHVRLSLLLLSGLAFAGLGGCASGSGDDAGVDATVEAECTLDSDCPDDGVFCNGTLGCVAGECVAQDIPRCDDGIACTVDACNPTSDACENTPDTGMCPEDTVCYVGTGCAAAPPCEFDSDCGGDGVYCNGDEVCVEGRCLSPMDGRGCDDSNSCTMDECLEATAECSATAYPDIDTNVAHCGTGADDCVVCPDPPAGNHQVAQCVAGACGFACEAGYVDLDGDPANGCEVMCTPSGSGDDPDDAFLDANCDGIDGDRALAIFVSRSGNNARDGLTPETSVGTLSRALQIRAGMTSRTQILVATGTYTESATLAIPGGVGIYGGYSDDFLTRADARASITVDAAVAARASGLTGNTVIDRVSLTTTDRTGSSEPTVALIVANSQDRLRLRHLSLLAGRGGPGSDGGTVGSGSTGTRGANGVGSGGGSGGGSGSVRGGDGRDGRRRASGLNGATGSPGSCGIGGTGGAGSGSAGLGCNDGDPRDGGPGGPGCTGTPGAHGAGGDGIGALAGESWTPDAAGAGATGGAGGGGGGGGAGGGEDCAPAGVCIYCDTGRGGGGGGGGGTGGPGGRPGTQGGASIGVVLVSSTLVAEDVRIQTAGGGNGGRGRAGGNGGGGGGGGTGGTPSNTSQGAGGSGGRGGAGGPGGCGGGGGGGPSIAVWGNGSTARVRELSSVSYIPGAGGNAGSSCGNSGMAGLSANLRSAFIE